jgi:lysosomal alpha-glucosidase
MTSSSSSEIRSQVLNTPTAAHHLTDTSPFAAVPAAALTTPTDRRWYRHIDRYTFIVIFTMALLMNMAFLLFLTCCMSPPPSSASAVTGYPDGAKFDCHPDQKAQGQEMIDNCHARGCIWDTEGSGGAKGLTPACYYPYDFVNYELDHLVNDTLILKKTQTPSGFADDVDRVKVDIVELDDNRLRIRITDSMRDRWEPPLPVLNVVPGTNKTTSKDKQYAVTIEPGNRNRLTVTRVKSNVVVFQTDLSKLIYSNQFIQMIFNVTTKTLYGLGEHLGTHTKEVEANTDHDRLRFRFLNHDDPDNPQMASYGTHPFYLMYEDGTNDAHGFLVINSNPMDMVFTHTPAITVRTIGGIMDFFLFLGPTPLDVMRQKADLLGPAPLPPLWSLGFHLCRYGYESSKDMIDTYQANVDAGVPLDAQWADIDYMHKCNMFSYDHVLWNDLPQVIEKIHEDGRHFVPILDPPVSPDEPKGSVEYEVFMDGLRNNVYVTNTSNSLVKTRVWNEGYSIYPDYTNPNTSVWWKKNLKIFHDKIPYDGLWIDMNEPSAVDLWGQEGGCPKDNVLDRPQFNPMHPIDLEHKTICMSSQHHLGDHYNLHNLYAFYESKLTYELLAGLRNKRPFLLSRATTTGQHVYSSHWAGDISSRWDYFKLTISGVLSSSIFGMPLVGADICGFGDEASDELCARWSSVGAFYTFARNHNVKGARRQDPASRPGDVLESAKKNLNIRYSLLPYLYTLFYQNFVTGAPILRSLKMNYPSDLRTHNNDVQFMWGKELLISPILDQGKMDMDAYFPAGIWYDYHTGHVVSEGDAKNVTIDVPLTDINLAVRGGRILPTIPSKNVTTHSHKSLPFAIIAALDEDEHASGDLYWDDGDQVDAHTNENAHAHVKFTVKNSKLTVTEPTGKFVIGNSVSEVKVWGVRKEVEKVVLITKMRNEDGSEIDSTQILTHTYVNGRLRAFLPPGPGLSQGFSVKWSY